MVYIIMLILLGVPVVFTIWNIVSFIKCIITKTDKKYIRYFEIVAMIVGVLFTLMYMELVEILFVPWNEQLYNG